MSFAADRINDIYSGSAGGLIQAVKSGVIVALRTALNDDSLSDRDESTIHVDMEYPLEKAQYPGVWVQFSVSSLKQSGMGMLVQDRESGDVMQQFMFTGRVTLTLVALTSKERDQLADYIISMLAFSRVPNPNLYTENGFSESFSPLYKELAESPYLSMTVNADELRPGGQSINVGVPWDDTQLAYEDAYSFEVLGEFMLVTTNDGYYRLRKIETESVIGAADPVPADDGDGRWM